MTTSTVTITVYSKPNCQQCKATTKLLDNLGIPYTYVDVLDDHAAFDLIQAFGYTSVPVVMAGDMHWGGFRPDRIKALRAAYPVEDTGALEPAAIAEVLG